MELILDAKCLLTGFLLMLEWNMKTTIDIPEKTLEEAMRHTGAKTKREAIVTAVEKFNRSRRLWSWRSGWDRSCPNFMTQEGLQRMREDRKWEATP